MLAWLGRRDVTRPAVAFGVVWFGFIAVAQLHLTELERDWSAGFTRTAFAGGLVFIVAATLAGGTAPARGSADAGREKLRAGRLVVAALVLVAAGLAGAAYKAHVLEGIPLLSENVDEVRARAYANGETVLPAWSSALTGGFYIGMWCALAALWILHGRASWIRLAPLWLLAAAALLGVALEASRNLVVFAVTVPAIVAYVIGRPSRGRIQFAWAAAAVAVLLGGIGGLYVLRLERGDTAAGTYLEQQQERQPRAVRPLLPLYVNGVFPLVAASRAYEAVPGQYSYERGAASLSSLPDRAFPEGKSEFGSDVAQLMRPNVPASITWSVPGYQGRLIVDLGWRGVLLGSALLGLAFGSLHRWARVRTGLLPVAVIAFTAYHSAFLVYDTLLSFSLIAAYDLAVIALVGAFATRRTDEVLARVVRRRAPA
jgi:hypothetical protein